jgi:hypothetical protein
LCPLIAHTYFDDGANNAEQSRRSAVDEVGLALDADFDVVELTVAQRGSTLYAVGMNASSEQPSLVSVLQATALRDADQPLKLVVSDDLPGASEFAHALLELLISAEGAPYLGECRPLYLVASSRAALEALLATRTLLASDAAYARLRGHLHFGAYVSNAATGSLARSALADLAAEGFELVELDHSREGLLVAVAQARALGLQVILRDVDGYYVAPLCGLVAGLGTMKHVTTAPTPLRKYIRGSRRLLELNVAGAQPGATQLRYLGRAQDGELSSPLDERTPTLSTGDSAAPLAGTFLHFDGAAQQSLVLHDASLPAGFTRFAAIASLRLSSTALAPGERQVIASTRSAMSGWSLELVNDLGTTELRFETWIEEVSGGPVHYSASIPASSLATAGAQTALFGTTTYVELQTGPLMSAAGPFISDSAPIESGEAVTLGVAPNQTTGYFDGDLQLLKLVAY